MVFWFTCEEREEVSYLICKTLFNILDKLIIENKMSIGYNIREIDRYTEIDIWVYYLKDGTLETIIGKRFPVKKKYKDPQKLKKFIEDIMKKVVMRYNRIESLRVET